MSIQYWWKCRESGPIEDPNVLAAMEVDSYDQLRSAVAEILKPYYIRFTESVSQINGHECSWTGLYHDSMANCAESVGNDIFSVFPDYDTKWETEYTVVSSWGPTIPFSTLYSIMWDPESPYLSNLEVQEIMGADTYTKIKEAVSDFFENYYLRLVEHASRHGAYRILFALFSRPPYYDNINYAIDRVANASMEMFERLLDDGIFSKIDPGIEMDYDPSIPVSGPTLIHVVFYSFMWDRDLINRLLRNRRLPIRFTYDVLNQIFVEFENESELESRVIPIFAHMDPKYGDDEAGIARFFDENPEYAHLYEGKEWSKPL